jgi:cytidine deaminase
LSESNRARVSVVATHVASGREDEFLLLVDQLHGLIRNRGYGSDRLLQDESDPLLYYHFRTWTSPEAAASCAEDEQAQSLWQRLEPTMQVSHLVGMATPVEPLSVAVGLPGGLRSVYARRSGQDRRTLDLRPDMGERRGPDRRSGRERRTTGDRRSHLARRSGTDRRTLSGPAPEGLERREVDRRKLADRRSGADRRLGRLALAARHTDGRPTPESLVFAARAARLRASASFSGFKVGAALETADGAIVTGCNIENATYGLTVCAERVAMFKAISEGHRTFLRIAVVADTEEPTPPCGACRQILWEFGGDLEILLANLTEEKGAHRLRDLLPLPFDQRLLTRRAD